MFCTHCGQQIQETSRFCSACGSPVGNAVSPTALAAYADRLAVREQTSGTIWLIISILQLLVGIFGAWIVLIVGVLNLVGAIGSFRRAKQVRSPYPGMVEEYEKQLTGLIIATIYNLLIGAVIGVIGNIYDFCTRNYVLKNRSVFEPHDSPTEKPVLPGSPEARAQASLQQAYMLRAKNKHYDALNCLLPVVPEAGQDPHFLTQIGLCYRNINRNDKAFEYYNLALAADPTYALAHINIGVLLSSSKHYTESLLHLEKGISLMNSNRTRYNNQDYGIAHANYAFSLGHLGRLEEAGTHLQIAENMGYSNGAAIRKQLNI